MRKDTHFEVFKSQLFSRKQGSIWLFMKKSQDFGNSIPKIQKLLDQQAGENKIGDMYTL